MIEIDKTNSFFLNICSGQFIATATNKFTQLKIELLGAYHNT